MPHKLPPLPYADTALAPVISKETIEYHYGKHHQAYVNNLNGMIEGTPYANLDLEATIKKSWEEKEKKVFNNSAQVWNHTFYWHCMAPNAGGDPTGKAAEAIKKSFGDFKTFKEKFNAAAAAQFGSGWAWVVKDGSGGIAIETTSNAETPFATGKTCVFTVDVWEHAYYVDYRNARPKYLEEFWKVCNWDFFSKNLG